MEVPLPPRSHTALGGCGGCRVRAQSTFIPPDLLLVAQKGPEPGLLGVTWVLQHLQMPPAASLTP